MNNNPHSKAKVKPPRLDGRRIGVFSSRSPYRPNNIGLSLVKIDHVEGSTVYFSGVDLIDGTPVLDIKPYIPEYDCPNESEMGNSMTIDSNNMESGKFISELHTAVQEDTTNILPAGGPPIDIQNLENGFYSLSEALDKAKDKLTSCKSTNEESLIKNQNLSVTCMPEDYESDTISGSINSMPGAVGGEEEKDLDTFLCSIISKAAHDLSEDQSLHENQSDSFSKASRTEMNVKEQIRNFTHNTTSSTNNSSEEVYTQINQSLGSKHSAKVHEQNDLSSERNIDLPKMDIETDNLSSKLISKHNSKEKPNETSTVIAPWLLKPPVHKLKVTFTTEVLQHLHMFTKPNSNPDFCLNLLASPADLEAAIRDVLREEPRSVYRRQKCQDSLYYFTVDIVHVTCWFDNDEGVAQVLRLKPISHVTHLQKKISQ